MDMATQQILSGLTAAGGEQDTSGGGGAGGLASFGNKVRVFVRICKLFFGAVPNPVSLLVSISSIWVVIFKFVV